MKKRLISVLFAAMLVAGLTITTELQSKANESGPQIDGSYLTWESESTGIAGAMTRGRICRSATPRSGSWVLNCCMWEGQPSLSMTWSL